jgi:raffinose/stachyose/melibiose transport system substrate-binding protein
MAAFGGNAVAADAVTLWGLTGSDELSVVGPSVKEWNAAHPDSTIGVTFMASDAFKTKIRTAVGAGTAPTLIYGWAGGTLASYVAAKKVVDLTDDVASLKDKFLPAAFSQGVIGGRIYAVPMKPVEPVIFYYNKSVLDSAGVAVPKTWDEVLAAVKTLRDKGVAPFALAGSSKWPELMWEEYLVDRVAGPDAFADIMAGKPGSWSHPGILEANKMIQDLVKAGGFIDGFASVAANTGADVALLYTGKAAMLVQGSWVYTTFNKQAPDFVKSSLGYGAFPAVTGGKGDPSNMAGNPSGYYSISVAASDSERKAALDYIKNGVFDAGYVSRMISNGQVPPIANAADEMSKATDFGRAAYSLTQNAKHFQMSWDQALPPAQATALLLNLDQLFNLQITPEQFSDNMNKTIGQ